MLRVPAAMAADRSLFYDALRRELKGDFCCGSGSVGSHYSVARSIVPGEDAQPVVGLERIDMGRQMVRPRADPELFQRVGLDPGPGHLELQGHARSERVGALHHVIDAVDAFGSHMALRGNLGLCAVEVHPNQNTKRLSFRPSLTVRGKTSTY